MKNNQLNRYPSINVLIGTMMVQCVPHRVPGVEVVAEPHVIHVRVLTSVLRGLALLSLSTGKESRFCRVPPCLGACPW